MEWLNTFIQGSLLGGIYALFAIGLSLSFGIMRLVNIAHGDLIVLSAYVAMVVGQGTGTRSNLVPRHRRAGDVRARLRAATRTVESNAHRRPVAATAGELLAFRSLSRTDCWKDSAPTRVDCSRVLIETASLQFPGGISIGVYPLLVFGVALVALGSLQLLFYRTGLGRAFRAVSDDADTAELMGVDNRKLYAVALGIAMIFTAIAGVLFAIRTNFDPSAGPIRLILAFEAVIIGGLGSMWGTLIGGMVLGIAQSVGAALSPTWQILAGHIAFLIILIVRPSGLFPRTRD